MADDPSEHFHAGRDDWLFVTSGSNNVVSQFSKAFYIGYQIETWRGLILERRRRMKDLGITYRHVVAPEKLTIYDDRLDGLSVDRRLSPAARLTRGLLRRPRRWHRVRGLGDALRLRRTCIDLVAPMRAARAAQDLYYRTDSHWTFAGCHLAYLRICRALRAAPCADLAHRPYRDEPFVGDIGAHFDPPRGEVARFHERQRHAVRRYANPVVAAHEAGGTARALHTGAHVIYANDHARDRRRLLLFGDSFSSFEPTMLTILLAETFREVHFVWSTSLDWSYIARARPDIVLTEIAERFMAQVPDDRFDVIAYGETRYAAELAAYRSRHP